MLQRSYTWCTLILAQTNHRNTYWNCNWDGTPSRPLSWPWLRRWSGEPRLQLERRRMDDLLDCEILRDADEVYWIPMVLWIPGWIWFPFLKISAHISTLVCICLHGISLARFWRHDCALWPCATSKFSAKARDGSPRFAGPGSRNK